MFWNHWDSWLIIQNIAPVIWRLISLGEFDLHFVRLVTNNIDLSVKAQIQTQQHSNQSIHWTNQCAVQDRIPSSASLEERKPQSKLEDLVLKSYYQPTANVQRWFYYFGEPSLPDFFLNSTTLRIQLCTTFLTHSVKSKRRNLKL